MVHINFTPDFSETRANGGANNTNSARILISICQGKFRPAYYADTSRVSKMFTNIHAMTWIYYNTETQQICRQITIKIAEMQYWKCNKMIYGRDNEWLSIIVIWSCILLDVKGCKKMTHNSLILDIIEKSDEMEHHHRHF